MKRMITLLAAIIIATCAIFAQSYKRVGNKFIQQSTVAVRDTLVTDLVIVDSKGQEHQVIINKNSGSCYTWRTSKKGKQYRAYLKKEMSMEIAKELGIKYNPAH